MSRFAPQQPRTQPSTSSLHTVLSSQPGAPFNPNKPAFIPSPTGPHGNIAAAHLAQAQAQAIAAAQLQAQAQAQLHLNLQSLNAKIVQAQQLAMINGISVDDVLRRMGGLSEQEVGLLKLCVVREQEERLKAQQAGLMVQQQQNQATLQSLLAQTQSQTQTQTQTRAPLRTTSPPNITLNSPPPTSSTSAQEQRAAARLKVEQNLRARCGKEQQQQQQAVGGGWEEAFARMNIGPGSGARFAQGQGQVMTPPQGKVELPPVVRERTQQPQVSSPIMRSFSPANSVHSATSDSAKKDSVAATVPAAQNKHVQAVSWRAMGKLQQAPASPAASPLSVKLSAQNAENAVKSFNGVFGNKVVAVPTTTSPTSPTRLARSGSGSSGSGQSSVEDDISVTSSSAGGRRRRSSGSCGTGMTTPMSEGESGDKANYFGSKNLQVHGRDESYPLSKVSSKGSNASAGSNSVGNVVGAGVIGQGYPGAVVPSKAAVQFSAVIRQPHGPPGGADELGNKNFASRIRQKAVSDLSVLGRRVAQRSPTVPSY